jgi:ribose 5-phosphate isomerase B
VATPLVIANDHAGVAMKHALVKQLPAETIILHDLGTNDSASVDYPDFASALCAEITTGTAEMGVLICGSGIGMSIAANRHAGIRAALCLTPEMAQLARAHNNANVLVLGARLVDDAQAVDILTTFLATEFEGGRHETRVKKLG